MEKQFCFRFCSIEMLSSLKVIHYGSSKLKAHKINPIKNVSTWSFRSKIKPKGGLWTSPVNTECGWIDYCLYDFDRDISKEKSFLLGFKPTAKVLMIESYYDLKALPFRGTTGRVDWEVVSTYADAVWLTAKGKNETLLSSPYNLCGWDCESVLIMNFECLNI